MSVFVKDGGVWKESGAGGLSIKDANAWKTVDTGFVKDANVWKEFYKNSTFWFSKINLTGDQNRDPKIVTDPSGTSAYFAVRTDAAARLELFKTDAAGSFIWGKSISYSGALTCDVVADSTSVYVSGITNSNLPFLAKFDSAGNIQWQKTISYNLNTSGSCAIDIDNSGNIIAVFDTASNGYSGIWGLFVVKLNSSGSILAQKQLDPFPSLDLLAIFQSINIDSSGNLEIGLTVRNSTSNSFIYSTGIKLNNSLTSVLYDRYWGGIAGNELGGALAQDSSGAFHCIGRTRFSNSFNTYGLFIIRTDSGGTYRDFNLIERTNASRFDPKSAVIDDSDNIYIVGVYQGSGFNGGFVVKYVPGAIPGSVNGTNSSSLAWAKSVTFGSNTEVNKVRLKGDSLYISGSGADSSDSFRRKSFVGKIPVDGSLTGTVNGVTYSDDPSIVLLQVFNFSFFSRATGVSISNTSGSISNTSFSVSNSPLTITTGTFP